MRASNTFNLIADRICVTYAQDMVLSNISLTLSSGLLIGISGASGSGKSTLLRVLAGIQKPDHGSVVYTEPPFDHSPIVPSDKSILIPQKSPLIEHATLLENCILPALTQGYPLEESRQQAISLLQTLGLGDKINQQAQHISGGQQQRMAWVRAALMRRPIMCIDEPTAHLDVHTATYCIPFLTHLRNTQKTLILVASHDEAILGSCDQVYHLSHGQLTHA